MALTPSTMLPLGSEAPCFSLLDPGTGQTLDSNQLFSSKGTVVMFICNHCPYVKHINKVLVQVAKQYQEKGIKFIAINSNDVENYPEDGPEEMVATAKNLNYPFPYLYDATQKVAKAYQAACTPDFYLFAGDKKLVYRGQFDESTPGNGVLVTGDKLSAAMDCLLAGKTISEDQHPSVGCNIKWKE